MKVLVISRNAWDITNSIGNTVTNFFTGIEDLHFANIYFRSSRPNNNDCKWYYRVTEKDIVRNWFSVRKIGESFAYDSSEEKTNVTKAESKEKNLISFIQKNNVKLAYKLSDSLWYSKKWLNDNLKKFIEEFKPDVVFTFVKIAPQYYLTIKYLKENFNIPVFSWIADDEYSGLKNKKKIKGINKLKYILNSSSVVTGCCEEICDYYNSVFDCSATPLYKGCDLSAPVKTSTNSPIKLVYAGNLLYGRLDIIKRITEALEAFDDENKKVSFEIYSNTLLSKDEQNYFEQKSCTKYMGRRDNKTIVKCLADADVVLHVESFDAVQILKTKYSFSTKIIDCLQSGNIMLAVGPSEVASMRYINKIPGAYTIQQISDLDTMLNEFFSDYKNFAERAKQIRNFALKHHDIIKNSEKIKGILKEIVEGE